MKITKLATVRFLPATPLRSNETRISIERILSSLIVASTVSLAAGHGVALASAITESSLKNEQPFIDENNATMAKMMAAMTIKPTGDVDRDFVSMMVPHHQGAIDMARIELRYGDNQQLLRISQEIVVKQLQEIAAMRIAIGDKVSSYEALLAATAPGVSAVIAPAARAPKTVATASVPVEYPFLEENDTIMTRMIDDMAIKPTGGIDSDFVAMMVPHHQGAIDMAQAELRHGHNAQLRHIAQEIIVDEIQEIALMRFALGEALPSSIASPTNPAPTSAPRAQKAPSMSMQMAPHATPR